MREPNQTGIPDRLKDRLETLSGVALDGVRVRYNSPEPARVQAHAYAHDGEIHLAPGQERHLPHEAWHAIQQAQGRVRAPTAARAGVPVSDDPGLERESDVMGARAAGPAVLDEVAHAPVAPPVTRGGEAPLQPKRILRNGEWVDVPDNYEMAPGESDERGYFHTHDAPSSHGGASYATAGFQGLTGTFDPLALANATAETAMHARRAAAEQRNGELRNAAISTFQSTQAALQVAASTPLVHHLMPFPGSADATWYAAKNAKLQAQRLRTRPHED